MLLAAAVPLALAPLKSSAQAPPATPGGAFSKRQLEAFAAALDAAETHGLPPMSLEATAAQDQARAKVLQYARELHVGRLAPAAFPDDWGVRPPFYDPSGELSGAVAADDVPEWLASLPPPYAGYRGLRRALARYRDIAGRGGWPTVPEGPAFGLGATGARVAALRARLVVEDPAAPAAGDAAFDEPLQQAVVRAQKRFGLKPDGVADEGAVAALNRPIGERILQIIANMERWRWLPPTMPPTRVQVNSGAAIVTLFQNDQPVLSMKAVAGRKGDETPMLVSAIHSVVLNPPWNVPPSIASKELYPKGSAYLRRNGFRVVSTGDGGRRLQQRAGPQSSLGRYKFDFDNPYGVYLHDTPTQSTFARYSRQASHGCVRLEKPAALAVALLQQNPDWTAETIAAAVARGQTMRVPLPQPVPVFVLYWTAFMGAEEQMHFRSDPYGWDRLLLQKIGVLASPEAEA